MIFYLSGRLKGDFGSKSFSGSVHVNTFELKVSTGLIYAFGRLVLNW